MFARKVDDGLVGLIKRLDAFLTKNADKKICATVVVLAKNADSVSGKLTEIATANKVTQVPLTVAADGEAGPEAYKLSKDVVFTLVVYDGRKKVTASLSHDALDEKAQDAAVETLAKAAGVK